MPNNNSNSRAKVCEWSSNEEFNRHLFFNVLLSDLPEHFRYTTIPFSYIRWRLGVLRLRDWTIKKIYREWSMMGLVEIKTYHGIKILVWSDSNE